MASSWLMVAGFMLTIARVTAVCSPACQANCTRLAEQACTANADCTGFFMWPVPLPGSHSLLRTLGVGYMNTTSTRPQGGMDLWFRHGIEYTRMNNTGPGSRTGGPSLTPSYCWSPAQVPTTCPPAPAPRSMALWQPGIDKDTGSQISAAFSAHPYAYTTISVTWAFWNSLYNAKCNTSLNGLCFRTFGAPDSPAWTVQHELQRKYETAMVPIVEVCCVCVLNSSYDYQPAMQALVEDAVANNFSGYALDMICGGQDEPQRAIFLSTFQALGRAQIPNFSISWWTHYAYEPDGTFPNKADYVYTMDSYAYSNPQFVTDWVDLFGCQSGVGLEYPGSGNVTQVKLMFGAMTTDLPKLRAAGTWGLVPINQTDSNLWYNGMEQFLKAGKEL